MKRMDSTPPTVETAAGGVSRDAAPVLVSIAIVTRNRREQLSRAIASAYAQTHRPLEIVLVDNASKDDTVRMVREKWPEIQVIRMPRNIGCQPGRNIAMANCRGKYIFNLDDDGVLDQRAIERIVSRFESEPRLGVVDCWTPALESSDTAPIACRSMKERWMGNFQGGASALRSSLLREAGHFPEFIRGGSEVVLAAYILERGYEILHFPAAIMYHPPVREGALLKEHTYYYGWHVLKRAFLFLPWPDCLFEGFWGFVRGFAAAVRRGCPGAHLKGSLRFFSDLPETSAGRRPVSRDTLRKLWYLNSNWVSDRDRIADYRGYTRFMMLRQRWRRWLGKNSPGLSK